MKKKDSGKYLWYFIALGISFIVLMMILSSVLSIGERLSKIKYLDYAFYVVSGLVIYFLIIRPVLIIVFSPAFSVGTTLDKQTRKNYRVYKKVAKRLLTSDIPEEEKQSIKEQMRHPKALKTALSHTFEHHIKKQMNKTIRANAKTVMISTAISQNGRLDLFTVLAVNLKMIKELVEMCGFRPSYKNLSKLTINVMTTALIAEGLENMDLSDILPNKTMNVLGELPLVKPLVGSTIQGISNALLTLRIGIVTRKYLFDDASDLTKEKIRRGALIEAAAMLPSVIGEALILLPKKIASFFKKEPKNQNAE